MSDASDELSQMRENYTIGAFRRSDLRHCPIEQFSEWMKEVKSAEIIEPNACTLATSRIGGSPSTRSVLLKGIENGYFLFFTNFGSRKARELKENPQAVMHFPKGFPRERPQMQTSLARSQWIPLGNQLWRTYRFPRESLGKTAGG